MAYIADPNLPKPEEQQIPLTGGGGLIGGSGSAGAPATLTQQPAQNTGFTNIQRYIEANRPQAGQLAEKVVAPLEQQRTALAGQVPQVQQNFLDQLLAQNPIDQNLINTAAGTPTALTDPQVEAFRKIYTGQYAGPGSIGETEPFLGLTRDYGNLQTAAESTGTARGQFALLSALNPNTTTGIASLDQLLLAKSPEATQTLGDFRARVADTGSQLPTLEEASKQAVKERQDALKQAAAQTQQRFTQEVIPGYEKELQTGYQSALDAANKELANKYRFAFDQPTINLPRDFSPEYMDTWMQEHNINLNTPQDYEFWLSPASGPTIDLGTRIPTFNPGIESWASPEQFAREKAYETLMGTDLDLLQNSAVTKAGTFDPQLQELYAAAPTEGPGIRFTSGDWNPGMRFAGGEYSRLLEYILGNIPSDVLAYRPQSGEPYR